MWPDKNINNSLETFNWAKSLEWIKNKTKTIYTTEQSLGGRYSINMRVKGDIVFLATRAA